MQTPDDCLVLKQPLAKLRVASDWPFDRERVLGEHACMAYLGEVLRPGEVPGSATSIPRRTSW